MDLFVIRHGEAGRSSPTRDESKRALTMEGEKEMRDISKGIKALGVEFDYIFTSPLLRAKQTAQIIYEVVPCKNSIQEVGDLRPEGNKLQLYNKFSRLKQDSAILIVGHEPYLSELVVETISTGQCRIDLKKGGLARIRMTTILPKPKGELRWLLTPKHLKRIVR
ncbi:MAG TPA: phosphohistidine phosphatase SixA [Candidatus Nitrosotalea sp.]|nr:phosphohistidine phosphatase SixA [Candidatus Nitrosotalea sp.]